ncbi:MAG: hypothetical protein R3Y63_14085 [Eubacteriales bacterium]
MLETHGRNHCDISPNKSKTHEKKRWLFENSSLLFGRQLPENHGRNHCDIFTNQSKTHAKKQTSPSQQTQKINPHYKATETLTESRGEYPLNLPQKFKAIS